MDLLAFEDLDLFGTELDDPLEELRQDLFHRMIEAPGSNLDDPDRGLGLLDMLSGVFDPGLANRIEAECLKDDRVEAAKCTLEDLGQGSFRATLEIEANGEAMGVVLEDDGAGGVRIVK